MAGASYSCACPFDGFGSGLDVCACTFAETSADPTGISLFGLPIPGPPRSAPSMAPFGGGNMLLTLVGVPLSFPSPTTSAPRVGTVCELSLPVGFCSMPTGRAAPGPGRYLWPLGDLCCLSACAPSAVCDRLGFGRTFEMSLSSADLGSEPDLAER